ncbi:hypothetical protein DH2020_002200 [Rehmannia glutinosa]|uniref:Uncharacterized protein n=1 Tax=Rehmannia glutinosa TaxID=99300 RepID=A0ABR0XTR8_REHGL
MDIKEALFSIRLEKSPGLGGMNTAFFQRLRDITGPKVVTSCLYFMNSCLFPEGFNDTNLVLIPKKNKPESVTYVRPITLCNVAYKESSTPRITVKVTYSLRGET